MTSKPAIWTLFLGVGLGVAALDLWTKELAFDALEMEIGFFDDKPYLQHRDGRVGPHGLPHRENIVVIPKLFEFEAALNYGAFKGWFGEFTGALAIVSLIALVFIAGILWFTTRGGSRVSFWLVLALALLWGGTLGNFHDRALIGGVRDFIKWFVVVDGKEYVWPNFNIADSAICVGVGVIILLEITRIFKKQEDPPAESVETETEPATTRLGQE